MVLPPTPTFYARLVGGKREGDGQDALREANPLTHINGQGPPLLLTHRDCDATLSLEHSRWLFGNVREDGGEATLIVFAGANHEDQTFHRGESLGAVAAFFQERLSTTAESTAH
ncbi:prolyl oligopeptidase family serine peptidase [Streptomyces sp. NPDC047081]|uniref:alpha/beta hydrolase family protein n=1 Tax=Streptomyces sp. NPDC047081 TaxID=3154706 RepID=UPI0033FA894F